MELWYARKEKFLRKDNTIRVSLYKWIAMWEWHAIKMENIIRNLIQIQVVIGKWINDYYLSISKEFIFQKEIEMENKDNAWIC